MKLSQKSETNGPKTQPATNEEQLRRDIHRVVHSNAPHCHAFLCSLIGECPPDPPD